MVRGDGSSEKRERNMENRKRENIRRRRRGDKEGGYIKTYCK